MVIALESKGENADDEDDESMADVPTAKVDKEEKDCAFLILLRLRQSLRFGWFFLSTSESSKEAKDVSFVEDVMDDSISLTLVYCKYLAGVNVPPING